MSAGGSTSLVFAVRGSTGPSQPVPAGSANPSIWWLLTPLTVTVVIDAMAVAITIAASAMSCVLL